MYVHLREERAERGGVFSRGGELDASFLPRKMKH